VAVAEPGRVVEALDDLGPQLVGDRFVGAIGQAGERVGERQRRPLGVVEVGRLVLPDEAGKRLDFDARRSRR
jgi:hypothetical protein